MDTALWIIQIILAIKLINVAFTHGFRQSLPSMQEAIQKTGKGARPILSVVAAGTFLGVLGLILPGVLGLSSWITAGTAVLLACILLFSIFFHVRGREKPKIFVSAVLFAFAAFVAYGRWMIIH
jgi:putative oxidoreductase